MDKLAYMRISPSAPAASALDDEFWRDAEAAKRLTSFEAMDAFILSLCERRAWNEHADRPLNATTRDRIASRQQSLLAECVVRGLCSEAVLKRPAA
jgi:hypothetical protein